MVQTVAVDAHLTIAEVLSGLGTVSWLLIGLLIRNSLSGIKLTQAQDKQELLENQQRVKEELVSSQTRIKEELVANQSRVKEELVASQSKMREELLAHTAEIRRTVDVHQAQDNGKFEAQTAFNEGVGRTLSRLDAELSRRERKAS